MPMPDQAFGDNSALLWQVVLEVDANGAVPVDFVGAWSISARGAVEAAAYSLNEWVCQLAFHLLYDLAHDLPGCVFGFLWDDFAEREQRGDKMDIGIHLLQHLWLQKHLCEIEAL